MKKTKKKEKMTKQNKIGKGYGVRCDKAINMSLKILSKNLFLNPSFLYPFYEKWNHKIPVRTGQNWFLCFYLCKDKEVTDSLLCKVMACTCTQNAFPDKSKIPRNDKNKS